MVLKRIFSQKKLRENVDSINASNTLSKKSKDKEKVGEDEDEEDDFSGSNFKDGFNLFKDLIESKISDDEFSATSDSESQTEGSNQDSQKSPHKKNRKEEELYESFYLVGVEDAPNRIALTQDEVEEIPVGGNVVLNIDQADEVPNNVNNKVVKPQKSNNRGIKKGNWNRTY